MKEISALRLEWKRRPGGLGRTKREFLDFVVDGKSLSTVIGEGVGDQISCLGWFASEENAKAVRRLLLEEPADFPNDRRSLYVCPECGDLGCGAISVVIEAAGDQIVWRDFGFENNYDNEVVSSGYAEIGPIIFDRADYETIIRSASSNAAI